ncbi:hypothetical protein [Sorangium sp. So ce590]|uniref:hypothetical protein n=1 Tax=unclassified Sorangium TaxID=2621164 RepID=UPI003F5DDE2D
MMAEASSGGGSALSLGVAASDAGSVVGRATDPLLAAAMGVAGTDRERAAGMLWDEEGVIGVEMGSAVVTGTSPAVKGRCAAVIAVIAATGATYCNQQAAS